MASLFLLEQDTKDIFFIVIGVLVVICLVVWLVSATRR